jgi:tetratricopeptide (TPR) repeat protein
VAHLNLGLVMSSLGRVTEAMSVLAHVDDIDDDGLKDPRTHKHAQVSALFNLGRLQLESGQPLMALRTLTKAETMAKDISYEHMQSVYNLLGESHQTLNHTEAAERFYRKAVALKPDHIPAYLKYGKMLAKNVSLRRFYIRILK